MRLLLLSNAFTEGSLPLNLVYSFIASSEPPLDKMFSKYELATSLLKIPFSLNSSKASASIISDHL